MVAVKMRPISWSVHRSETGVFGSLTSQMITLILATRNAHKVAEIRALLSDRFHYRTLADFEDAPVVNEDAATFVGNATRKAVQIAAWLMASPHRWAGGGVIATAPESVFVLADD